MQAPEEVAPRHPAAAGAHASKNDWPSSSRRPKPPCSAANSPRRPDATPWSCSAARSSSIPSNTLAKAGLVRVADRLLSAAERALTAGSVEDAKKMVAVAETLTPATARGAFLMMQIEREHERAALTRAKDSDAQDKLEKRRHVPAARERAPAQWRAHRTFRGQRTLLPGSRAPAPARDDPALAETRASAAEGSCSIAPSAAASAGNAAETERWLANADGAGAARGHGRHSPLAAGHGDRRARRQDDGAHAVVHHRAGREPPAAAGG